MPARKTPIVLPTHQSNRLDCHQRWKSATARLSWSMTVLVCMWCEQMCTYIQRNGLFESERYLRRMGRGNERWAVGGWVQHVERRSSARHGGDTAGRGTSEGGSGAAGGGGAHAERLHPAARVEVEPVVGETAQP